MKHSSIIKHILMLEYQSRLDTVLGETDVVDEEGNIIISPGLKVRHKDSGFEYTVDRVIDDAGNISVVLRSPDDPRFIPPPEEDKLLVNASSSRSINEEDPHSGEIRYAKAYDEEAFNMAALDAELEDIEEFVVDQKEFEKDYEVH